ncbi:serine/threonine-protein kinase [Merismopedia glauca]|uniref:Serine/threonine protein kinase n=1 Tax=Merismopedia glauca CCAP 1448/3 TaxID=1296344 RepID=A0A2T1C1X1_9CYAN|nr:serine/threonine-protein kinase [Merismopedia glauca]PSB02261.1 serine/threonine protein kinase [Merismopedia glauca CCAP 1448/3]
MSYCSNPNCPKPHSPGSGKFCLRCGHKLLLGDRYRLYRLIGKGTLGRTFLAKDEGKLSQPVCTIKEFLPPLQSPPYTEAAATLFEKQALVLEQIGNRPHIPEVLAYFTQNQQQLLVTKFIEGQNLAEELAQQGTFTESKIRELLTNLLPVLVVIHSRQIIHRDIKPENLIRSSINQELFLVDFGNVDLIASPHGHIAPEQTQGKTRFASDIYSLGSSCMELFTNIKPEQWRGKTKLLGNWLQPLSSNLASILKRMLEPDLKQRYTSAREVLRDLHSPPVTITPAPLAEPPSTSDKDPLQQTWSCIHTIKVPEVFAGIKTVAISPQGNLIASCSDDRTLKTWDSETFREVSVFIGHNDLIRQAIFTPDGEYILTASNDKTIRQWNVETGRTERVFAGHTQAIASIAFNPTRQILASGSLDRQIKLWDWQTGLETRTLSNHTNYIRALAFSPDSQLLASGSDDRTCKLWEIATGEQISNLVATNWLQSLAFSPDGTLIAGGTVDNQILVWDVASAKLSFTLSGHQGIIAGIESVAFSPNGQILASAGAEDKTIKLWHIKTQTLLTTLSGHRAGVSSIVFSPDGRMLVSGSYDKSLKFWLS